MQVDEHIAIGIDCRLMAGKNDRRGIELLNDGGPVQHMTSAQCLARKHRRVHPSRDRKIDRAGVQRWRYGARGHGRHTRQGQFRHLPHRPQSQVDDFDWRIQRRIGVQLLVPLMECVQ